MTAIPARATGRITALTIPRSWLLNDTPMRVASGTSVSTVCPRPA